ncbi:hypothetical protein AHF37_11442 [Paragonimus kellicotti]|nr:hypothetical protein AHF37_11442 [Paragonimus kellicotti]
MVYLYVIPEFSGSSKLTKLIDSVRRSWPTNRPLGQKKNEPFPIANLTALAYGDSPADVKQMSIRKPVIRRPLRRNHSGGGGSNSRQPSAEGSNTVQQPTHIRQSLERTSLEQLTYTPVRLYTPPPPNTLTLESTVPTDTEMRMPLHQTAPPLQLGQSSLFRVRQLSQNLRAERQQHHELQSADKLILPCSHASRSQQRHPQLQRRDALLYHRSGSELRPNRSNSPACQLGQDLFRRNLLQAAERTLGSNNHHTLRPPMKRHTLRISKRSISTLNLNGHWVKCKKDVPFDSNFNLPYSVPGPLLETSAFSLAHAESERTHSMRRSHRHPHCARHLTRGKRPISRPVSNLPTNPNAPHSAGDWYPVRRRIIAAKYPDFFPSEPPQPIQPIFEYEQRALTPNNRSLSDLSSATTSSTKQGEVAHESAPLRRLNRWGDEPNPPPPRERIMDLPSHPISSPSHLRATWSIESGDTVTHYPPY